MLLAAVETGGGGGGGDAGGGLDIRYINFRRMYMTQSMTCKCFTCHTHKTEYKAIRSGRLKIRKENYQHYKRSVP